MIYTSESAALAALEMLVHVSRFMSLTAYVVISCDFDEKLVSDVGKLPSNWRKFPAPPELQAIGDTWARSAKSAVLRVPSTIVPSESNYLLNPAHANFGKIKIGKPERFELDVRLMR